MDADLLLWIGLNRLLTGKLKTGLLLLDHFNPITKILSANEKELNQYELSGDIIKTLQSQKHLDESKKEIDWLKKKGYTPISYADHKYPGLLREIFNPPFVLYLAGEEGVLSKPSVSLVGARRPSPYGRVVAEKLACDLARRGLVVVSGMARGIDSIAHRGALKEGKSVAVLGSGLNRIYPAENYKLFEKMIQNGAVVTEFPMNSPPLGYHFPMRNRIISGLSAASVIIEAAVKSGSLITAQTALDQNREVMAVPGNITSELSKGTNWLIQNGAHPVSSGEDIIDALPLYCRRQILPLKSKSKRIVPLLSFEEKKIYNSLNEDCPIHIDEIITDSSLSVQSALSILLRLELEDLVLQFPGKYYQRKL